MIDILRFEKDGVVYAKGFHNQEGLSFYVLPGYRKTLEKALEKVGQVGRLYLVEETHAFPGDTALQDPEGLHCAFCGKVNDYWDAEGWFYLWTDPKKSELENGRPACRACVKGEPGKQHERLHGKENGSR